MAWQAKITSITPRITPYLQSGEDSVQYKITVEFFLEATPTDAYVIDKVVAYTVTPAQVLAFIKKELSDLNSGDVLPTVITTHLGEVIDASTTW